LVIRAPTGRGEHRRQPGIAEVRHQEVTGAGGNQTAQDIVERGDGGCDAGRIVRVQGLEGVVGAAPHGEQRVWRQCAAEVGQELRGLGLQADGRRCAAGDRRGANRVVGAARERGRGALAETLGEVFGPDRAVREASVRVWGSGHRRIGRHGAIRRQQRAVAGIALAVAEHIQGAEGAGPDRAGEAADEE
jgi:hypothetical protein